ncbi:Unknown protein [Striga hermonthica]|uniref:CST complex subunit CTC1 n=1 Tax=Striga hermonthica TaxID=68872 RepID=A0A9N7MI42_STRHE|nr:Unknown protein [Striga hermonthica]
MEDVTNTALTISHIIQRGRPLTAASPLVAARPIFISKPQKNPGHDNRKKPSSATLQDPNPKTLEPLNQPTTLIGALTLPSFFELTSPIKCSCFQFSDYSATICCDVLDFDPIMIGREIKVLAWNFIPLKCDNKGVKSGFLEIISWDFLLAWTGEVCCSPNLGPFCLNFGACDVKDKIKTSCLIFGAIESISPVFVVPCTNGESSSKNVSGFLVSLLTCQCKFCASKFLVQQLKDLSEINVKDHYFCKTAIAYFCASTSSWHPMMSRFIGNIVLLRGLKKRLVYIKKEESQLMHVTTDETSLHIAMVKDQGRIHNAETRRNAEFGSYTGVITGMAQKYATSLLPSSVYRSQAKGFRLVIEGMHPKLVDFDSTIYQPLSCRSIFSNALPLKRMKLSIYLCNCLIDEDSRGHSVFFELNEKSEKLENAKFHLLLLTYKFPIKQKFQGDLAKGSNMFAQAIILPWDLLLDGASRDTVMIVAPSEYSKVSVESIARHENHLVHKRRKPEQIPIKVSNGGLNDARNGISDSCSSCSNPCVWNNPLELPCVVATKGVSCYCTGMLFCANELTEIVCVCKLPMRKVLLEFDPDSFSRYEVSKIGRCYLVSHQEEDMLCSIKENYQVSRAKVNVSSGTILRSISFSSIESLHSSHLSNEFPCPPNNEVDSKIHSEISVFVPSSALNLLESFTKAWERGPSGPNYSLEEVDNPDLVQPVIDASMQSLSISRSNCNLPEGNLITLHGPVVALHECNDDAFPAHSKPIIAGEGYLPMFHNGNGGGVCVHVLVDSRMARIICDVGKQTFPVGLGRDTYATFHRILVVSGQDKYMMTPVSFITINNTSLMNKILADEEYDACTPAVGLTGRTIPEVIPISLICDAFQLLEPKAMQFHCRVVAVYTLLVEKAGTSAVSQSSATSEQSALGIPFAGFVIDDGSSCCCCWADSERAAMLLGLEPKEHLLQDSAETLGVSKSGTGSQCSSTINQLNQMLEKHGRIVVKNYGSLFDSSCQDLSFSVGSDGLIGSSDEDLLRSLIADAISSVSWTIDGNLMDAKLCSWLQEHLTKVDMAVPTLLNIWARNVGHTDVLEEARNIIRGFKL